jgi:ubiquinone/menaquinone biosynthesis C-methylase UbiE
MNDPKLLMKERNLATWSSGDYSMIGVMFVPVSELLCEAVELRAGHKVLDVATGTGNTALAAARRFGEVTGIDIVSSWLERARDRAAVEKLPAVFMEGDAESLDFPDNSFDVVLSTFGCMFAPDQEKTASELLRVCRPGGKIGLASWTPFGYTGELFKTISNFLPEPPREFTSPTLWGTEERLNELFAQQVDSIRYNHRIFNFRFLSAQHAAEINKKYVPPMAMLYTSLDDQEKASFDQEMGKLYHEANRSGDESILIPAEYLETVITKRSVS